MTTLTQRTFASGEISPSLYARVDLVKYSTGLRTCYNCFVLKYGGTSNRSGTKFIGEVSDSSKSVNLIPFIYNDTYKYVLEFGQTYMRVIKDGDYVKEAAVNISGATQADPVVITTSSTHGYSTDDEVYISGVAGMTELNNRNFKITVLTTTTFSLQLMDNTTDLDGTGFTAYSSGGTTEKIYEITTSYTAPDVGDLKYAQTGAVLDITHNSYSPAKLTWSADDSWSLADATFEPEVIGPSVATIYVATPASTTYKYIVTAIDANGNESVSNLATTNYTISSITAANPPKVTTSSAHGWSSGDIVELQLDASSTPDLNGKVFRITKVSSTEFYLQNIDLSGETVSLTGTNKAYAAWSQTNSGSPTTDTTNYIQVTWDPIGNEVEYNVYKWDDQKWSLMAITSDTTAYDIGQDLDNTIVPPVVNYLFATAGNYPANVNYVQQRKVYSNTENNTELVAVSEVGDFDSFVLKTPIVDSSGFNFTLNGSRVNAVTNVFDLAGMVVFTKAGEWSMTGGQDAVLSPTTLNMQQLSYNGSSSINPILIGATAIYVQERESSIYDFNNGRTAFGETGEDLTVYSRHMFDGYTVSGMAYQKNPNSTVWVVRSDGTVLGCTYLKNQQVLAWHEHNLGGTVENVCVVPDGGEDALYMVVRRTINGSTVRYVEKLSTRMISDIKDSTFMDSHLSYDGRNTGSTTMTLSGGTLWDQTETLTLTASSSYFDSADVGNEIHIEDSTGDLVMCEITAYTSGTVVSVRPNKTVPTSLRSTAVTTWSEAVDQVTGLWHLEGEDVAVFGDGFVVASPNNSSYTTVSVSNGTITLDRCYAVIHVGLPYISNIETLDIDNPTGETIADKNVVIGKVTCFVEDTRGVWVGPKPPSDDTTDPLEGLTEFKIRDTEDYVSPVSLTTDKIDVIIQPEWNSNGRVYIRQIDPIPMSILSVHPAGKYPF